MVTKKQLEERLNLHLESTHGYVVDSDGTPHNTGLTMSHCTFRDLRQTVRDQNEIIRLLLSRLGLEVKQTEAVLPKTVLVKKAAK